MHDDLFTRYIMYNSTNETPATFHRWSMLVAVGALLGRAYHLPFGQFKVYPNMYAVLLGVPGTRKSTAIKIAKRMVASAGYKTFAPERTTKEKFLLDLAGEESGELEAPSLTQSIFGEHDSEQPREMFICSDELYDFMGQANIDFISMLGSLWDWEGTYSNRLKNSKSVEIRDPTISLLGGATPTTFSLAFPPDILGQGFFSRMILVHGVPSGKKIWMPTKPSDEETAQLVGFLESMRNEAIGEADIDESAQKLLQHIYGTWEDIQDARFANYSNRRFTHLLKLCLLHSAAREDFDRTIREIDVIRANTVLTHAENNMTKALGEFGRAKNSEVRHKVLEFITESDGVSLKQIFTAVGADLNNTKELSEILAALMTANKIQVGKAGYLPVRKPVQNSSINSAVDFSLLTPEERGESHD